MENIVINFTNGDTSSLQSIVDHLEEIIKKEGDVGIEWKKTSDKIEAGNKINLEGTNKFQKSIADLAAAAKTLDKNIIGGAYKDYLGQLKTALGLTSKELIEYIKNARASAQQSIFDAKTDEEIAGITAGIEAMNDQLKILEQGEDGVVTHTKSLRGQLQAMKLELAGMEEGTPAFIALRKQAGELDDKIKDLNASISSTGSDTKHLDGLISLAGGVAGGYAVAQGAAALFGAENEDVQKALLKVNAAMSILQGLQQIQQVLQKESSANLLLNTLFRKANTVATVEGVAASGADAAASGTDAAAKIVQAGATTTATTAQTGLNLAMLASPAGVVLLVIAELIGLYQIFTRASAEAQEAQHKLNLEIEAAANLNQLFVDAIGKGGEVTVAKMKAAGDSAAAIRRAETFTLKEQIKQTEGVEQSKREAYEKTAQKLRDVVEGRIDLNADEIKELRTTASEYEKIQSGLIDLRNKLELKTVADTSETQKENFKTFEALQNQKIAKTIAGSDAEKVAQINAIRAIAAEREKNDVDFTALPEGQKAAIRAEDDKKIQGLQLDNYGHFLKGKTALDEAYFAEAKLRLLKNKVDTIADIDAVTAAEISALKKRRDEAIKGDPNLNKGESRKIVAETNLQIEQLQRAQAARTLAREKDVITQTLALTKKGSKDEHDRKLELIDIEQRAALAAEELTAEQIDLILKNSDKKRLEADRVRLAAIYQDQIEIDNAALDRFGLLESEKLTFTLDRLEVSKQKELLNADLTAAQIAAIESKYDKLTRDAKIASIEIIKNKRIEAIKVAADQEVKLNERILASDDSSLNQKVAAIKGLQAQKDAELAIELAALEDLKDLDENYAVKHAALINQGKDIAIDAAKQVTAVELSEVDKRLARYQEVITILQTSLDGIVPKNAFSEALKQAQNFGVQVAGIYSKLKIKVAEYNAIIEAGRKADATAAEKKAAEAATIEEANAKEKAGHEAKVAIIQGVTNIVNQIYADQAAARARQLDEDIAKLEENKAKELNNVNLTAKQKDEIETRYREKERQVKIKAFEADKRAKVTQAIINGLLAATAALPNFVLAALAVASSLITAGLIGSQPTPKFKKGKVDIMGPVVNTDGEIPAIIHVRESVINASATAKWKEALVAINTDQFEGYLMEKIKSFGFPQVPEFIQHVTNNHFFIDYDKMGHAIAKRIPEPVIIENNIDEEGLHRVITKGGSRIEYKNKRYTMRP